MQDTQLDIEHDIVKPIQTKTVLSKEQFKELYTFLNIIKPHFEDLCIVNGKFRTRSNDSTCIVETKFSYFKGININIANIKMLVKMLYTLNKKAAITIAIEDTKVTFTDGCQSVQIMKAIPDFIDNKFMTDEEMKELLDNNIEGNNLFIKETLPKSVVCNINKITGDLGTSSISVKHTQDDLNNGYFYISNQSRDREYTIKLKEAFITPMKKDHFFKMTSLPFIFNKADMTLCYYIQSNTSIITTIYSTTVDGLLIYMFARAALFEEWEKD